MGSWSVICCNRNGCTEVAGGLDNEAYANQIARNSSDNLTSCRVEYYSNIPPTSPTPTPIPTEKVGIPEQLWPIPEPGVYSLIELEIDNDTFAHSLSISSDFHRQVSELCALTGYKLTQIYQLYMGQVRIVVEKKGSWSILKLIASIIGIAILVLLAVFSGSVILAGIAVVGGFIAIHFVVRSFINEDLIQEGITNQQEAASSLKDLEVEIRNNPNLTDEQKSNLIQSLYEKILQIETQIGTEPPILPPAFPPAQTGESNLGKVLDLVPILIIGGLAIFVFSQVKKQ